MSKERSTDAAGKTPKSQGNELSSVPVHSEPKGHLRLFAATLMEWVLTVAAVLGFFLFLIWGSSFILPEGTSLISLENNKVPENSAESPKNNHQAAASGGVAIVASGDQLAAVLSDVKNVVKHKPADTISWGDALEGMRLYNQDAVKTANGAQAVIRFDDSNKLRLGPDSLVIVKTLEKDPWFYERKPALIVMEGELRGNMSASVSQKSSNVELQIPGGIARITTDKGQKEEIDYEIKVNPDQSTSVAVYRGGAEVEAENTKVKLGPNQVTFVVKGSAPTQPRPLRKSINITHPIDGTVSYYREFPQEILFDWKSTEEGRYRLEIARDILFEDIVVSETVSKNEFIHGNLHHGEYFWRVAAVNDKGSEVRLSESHRLEVVQDQSPPYLRIEYPQKTVTGETYTLKGNVEPGSTLIINGDEVSVDDQGGFEVEIKLDRGINIVAAQAVDIAGNATFVSERVIRQF